MAYDIGVVGLGVMGGNLARNIESRGYSVVGYDLDAAKTRAFTEGDGRNVAGASSAAHLAELLARPRKVLLMVPAGKPVDDVIAHVVPHLEAGDIVIDAGNSFFKDTDRREAELAAKGLLYLGTGRVWRRGRGAARPRHHARGIPAGLGRRRADLRGHRGPR